ncbi:maleylpyruvate isomerase family mycothiol-dependent enzyme [Pseudonocardia sp. C8]|uniref:maleylpyruvate isomerase family mycothiol-dependent enzyme n=1 Tax=Pseudonocardia sp. C8 TaxID=2762759 RepID=UPI001642E917|nr:maleylpyruvate isomerase family mycothiol-dependent enzyme [Pseudonocardia sp. C8]MBC3193146.1 maleylpyruvate isomerase family mycothiol-dependent enzyme [Pseudonocardia sp. C8]
MSASPDRRAVDPYAGALISETDRLAALIEPADPETAVPTCPGWSLRQLQRHVGRGHLWAAQMVASGATEMLDPREVAGGKPPAGGPDVAAQWLRDGATALLDAVAAAGPDAPVWTFTGPKPSAWWVRRRLHEAAVHRADVAIALGVPFEIAPELAADGVSEWLGLLAARPAGDEPPLAEGATLHLHATDDVLGVAGEWMIRSDGGRVVWEHGHGKGDAAVRGSAADLLQGVLRRIDADDDRLQVLGDPEVWRTWLSRTGF